MEVGRNGEKLLTRERMPISSNKSVLELDRGRTVNGINAIEPFTLKWLAFRCVSFISKKVIFEESEPLILKIKIQNF